MRSKRVSLIETSPPDLSKYVQARQTSRLLMHPITDALVRHVHKTGGRQFAASSCYTSLMHLAITTAQTS